MKRLNLGSGGDYKEGWINCDIRKDIKTDVVLDLKKKLPFEDNSVDEILMKHVLEHVPGYGSLLREMHRVCKRGAIINILVPFFSNQNMFGSPNHINFFNYGTLEPYEGLFHIKPHIDFFIDRNSKLIDKLINWKPYVYLRFFCWVFPSSQIRYKLIVKK